MNINWISVKEKPIVTEETVTEENIERLSEYNFENEINIGERVFHSNENTPKKHILAAVETNMGWDIALIDIDEEDLTLYIVGDNDDSIEWGWSITAITHYAIVQNPETNSNNA